MANENKELTIRVDDGYQRVPIKNLFGDEVGVFYFNPTDIGIIQRYNDFVKDFDSVLEPLESLSDATDNDVDELTGEQQKAIEQATERLYEAVNKVFNGDMAGAFFGKVHPFSPVGDGFYCINALEAVRSFITEQLDAHAARINANVSKYTKIVKKPKKK